MSAGGPATVMVHATPAEDRGDSHAHAHNHSHPHNHTDLNEIYANYSATQRAWNNFFATKEEADFPDPRHFDNAEDNIKNCEKLRGVTLDIAMRKIQSLFVKRTRFVTSGSAATRKQRLREFYADAASILHRQRKIMSEKGNRTSRKRDRINPRSLMDMLTATLKDSTVAKEEQRRLAQQQMKLMEAQELKAYVDMALALEIPVEDTVKRKIARFLAPQMSDDTEP